mgnify:CR=1 FL=1
MSNTEILDTDALSAEITFFCDAIETTRFIISDYALIDGKELKVDWGDGTITNSAYHKYPDYYGDDDEGVYYTIKIYNINKKVVG